MPRAGKYTLSGLDTRTARSPSGPGTVSSTAGDRDGLIGHAFVGRIGTPGRSPSAGPARRYRVCMPSRDPVEPGRPGDPADDVVADELIGLDPDDPETLAFAEHLGRMHNDRPSFTVEGYLDGVADFAESA